ncbi:hypothetical protein RsoM2USA_316 [Ralstonia phage RsoM2USA]|nr:hypothetical protein RsoM2USA_316 [Ralstonia phage RsoM2USA]
MKLHEIRGEDERAIECWHWLKDRLISPVLSYEEFLDRFYVSHDTYVFDYIYKPIQMRFDGEWEGSPLKMKVGSINFKDSDCHKLEIESLIDVETNLYLTRCPIGNLNGLASSIEKINFLSIAGTEDVSGICAYIGALDYHNEFVLRMEAIDINADHRKIEVFDKSSTWRDEFNFDNVFDLQAWMIEKGFDYLV